ncbi:MAG: hypothetical protein Q7T54_02380 [Candidatus Levybacteria bacterium]|nr:hypothetical protein [Candidatus Levybacteria bacterium]
MNEFDREQIERAEWEGFGTARTGVGSKKVDRYQLEVADWEGFGAAKTPSIDEVIRQKEAIADHAIVQSMGERLSDPTASPIQEMTPGLPIYTSSS